ncbi:FixH family protein [Bacillus massiliglaciei]|uniref:FixH family protein n=1 Tax=Bacillus massiliglaciei TaxID=1816693 RepID=UPI000DA5F7E3|nr:FixH family protein [Bacillus massiliglaciei]
MKTYGLRVVICGLFLSIILTGCKGTEEQPEGQEVNSQVAEPMKAEIRYKGEAVEGKELIIETSVTQGEKPVDRADEVLFEIRKSGSDQREMIGAKYTENGSYQIMHAFPESGDYFVIAHVTAKGLHVMPEKKIKIISTEHSAETMQHPSTDFSVEFLKSDTESGNKKMKLEARLLLDGKPLSDANVSFEVWKDGSEDSRFIRAAEEEQGRYANLVTFDEKGTYKVQVHVEQGELHEHQLQTIEIK